MLKIVKSLLRPAYHFLRGRLSQFIFFCRRTARKVRRRGTSYPVKARIHVLCVKRRAYARLVVNNVNSLHYISPGYQFVIVADDACQSAFSRMLFKFDYPSMVQVVNRFGSAKDPWQFQKLSCLFEASRAGAILVDADTLWHDEPSVDPEKVTILVKAYDFQDNDAEKKFLLENGMARALTWPHYVSGFVSLPPRFFSEELARLSVEWTKKAFSDPGVKRISEEIGVNLALQTLVPREAIVTLKATDGPNDRNVMQSLYYGCVHNIEE
jgi:hypothetical protein